MASASHIHVRKMEIGDFEFVRELAAKQPRFTVPPLYVLWLLLKIKGAVALIAEDSFVGPVSYLLAVPVEQPENCYFVWQIASARGQRDVATTAVIRRFREIVLAECIRVIAFSSARDSAEFRAIRRYAKAVFSSEPEPITSLPSVVQHDEEEYQLQVL